MTDDKLPVSIAVCGGQEVSHKFKVVVTENTVFCSNLCLSIYYASFLACLEEDHEEVCCFVSAIAKKSQGHSHME